MKAPVLLPNSNNTGAFFYVENTLPFVGIKMTQLVVK